MLLKYLDIIRNRFVNKSIIPWICCGLLSLNACNSIEKKNDLPNKKVLEPIVNPFQTKKVLGKKIIDLNSRDIINSAISLSNGKKQLFIAGFSGKVTSVDLAGKHLWSKSLGGSVTAGPVLFEDKLLVITSDAKLFCLQAKNGETLWNTVISSDALAAPTIDSGTAFIHTLDGGLSAISLQDGRQLWRISTVLPNMTLRRGSAPAVSGNYVVAGFANGKLFAINKENGNVLWTHNLSIPKGRTELQRITDITADPVIVNNIVYAVSYQGNLTAIKLISGEPLWEKELSSYSGITVDENAVYISTIDGKVLAIDNKTGAIFWVQDDLMGRMLSKPIIFNKYLVVGDQDGNLHFLDQLYGYIKGRLFLDSSGITMPPLIINKNQLHVLTNNGYLEVIEIS